MIKVYLMTVLLLFSIIMIIISFPYACGAQNGWVNLIEDEIMIRKSSIKECKCEHYFADVEESIIYWFVVKITLSTGEYRRSFHGDSGKERAVQYMEEVCN